MKGKKVWLSILSIAFSLISAFALASCKDGDSGDGNSSSLGVDGKSAYELYCQAHPEYTGTMDEWLESLRGTTGAGIASAFIDENGKLVLTLTDGTVLDGVDMPDVGFAESLRYQKIADKEEYRVMGMGTVSDLNVVIPSTYRGLPVTEIGAYAFSQESYIESVTIPDTITFIGDEAFDACDSLEKVQISDLAAWCNTTFDDTCIFKYGANLYLNGEKITDLVIPDGVTSINKEAFEYCSGLTSVTIPDSVTTLGKYAFYNCDNLSSVTIGNSVATIGNSAFSGCGLTSITIPDSVTAIEDSTFYSCSNLVNATLGNSVATIGNYAFAGCGLTSITIPDSVTTIGEGTFQSCNNLASATLGNGVTTIGNSAFSNCGLTSITIPQSVTFMGDYAFRSPYLTEIIYNATDLQLPTDSLPIPFYDAGGYGDGIQVTIGANVKIIPTNTFGYANVVKVTFATGSVCQSIGNYAFYSCGNLESVTLPDSVTWVGEDAFYGCNLTLNEYKNGAYLGTESNPYFMLMHYTPSDSVSEVELHQDTKIIGMCSLYLGYYTSSVISIIIPNGVTHIQREAIMYNRANLTSVFIPDSVIYIGPAMINGGNVTVYCEAESQPDGWHEAWNYGQHLVEWGYTA